MVLPFPEPTQERGSRAEALLGYLDYFRELIVDRVTGLAPDVAERTGVPSGWTPVQLAHHLRHVERRWLEWGFLGLDVDDPWADQHDGRWRVPGGTGRDEALDELRAQGTRTREIVMARPLDERGRPGPRWEGADPPTLERVLLHLVQEYARHLGQLDVVVELAGGPTGE